MAGDKGRGKSGSLKSYEHQSSAVMPPRPAVTWSDPPGAVNQLPCFCMGPNTLTCPLSCSLYLAKAAMCAANCRFWCARSG